jgi:hypothetical protein
VLPGFAVVVLPQFAWVVDVLSPVAADQNEREAVQDAKQQVVQVG